MSAVSEAWRQAATDLGIRVRAPYSLVLDDNEPVQFEALIYDFGGPKGTLVTTIGQDDKGTAAKAAGFFWSQLSDSYGCYDRTLFRETLDDWGWFGSPAVAPPAWYTGRSWS